MTPARASLRISSSPRTICASLPKKTDASASRVRATSGLEREGGRIETRALQTLLEAAVSLWIAREIDELLIREVERDRALVDADQRRNDLFAHKPRGVDFRLAPTRRQPLLRDKRQDDLAAVGGLLQRFLPALAGDDAALGIEIEEDVVPAILRQPVADPDGLVAVGARMADEKARHGMDRR